MNRAMIFAAGLGTRLQHLTHDKPKALALLNGKPLLQHVIEKLRTAGVTALVINVHHFAEGIIRFLEENRHFGLHIDISDERGQLLDTGSGLIKAAPLLEGPDSFWVINTDVISNIDLHAMRTHHLASAALATLAVRNRSTSRYFLFDQGMNLCGWRNKKTGEEIITGIGKGLTEKAFSGIQIIDPAFFSLCPLKGKFSITEAWIELSRHQVIKAYPHDHDYWFDLGTPEALVRAGEFLKNRAENSTA